MKIRSQASRTEEGSTTISSQRRVDSSESKRGYLDWMYDNRPIIRGKIQSNLAGNRKQFIRERNKSSELIGI